MHELPLGVIWSIWPQAWQQLQALLAAALRNIAAGPVDDARRLGLPVDKRGDVAIVSLRGPMIKNAGFLARWGFAGTKETQRAIEHSVVDEDVNTIILNVDSPGGSVDGLAELADAIRLARKSKTVLAQVSGMAASAAYYVASQAETIYAGRMDLIGSIGTRMLIYDYFEMFREAGVKAIAIDTGEHKSAGAVGTELTEEQIAEFQRIVDGFFADFISAVRTGRGLPKKAVNSVADGRVFFAAESIELGLIDAIQPIEKTLAQAEKPRRARTSRLRNETKIREHVAKQ